MAGNDQANRALLEQLMKLNQDIKVNLNFAILNSQDKIFS
jgi:hypothetical protein